MGKTHLKLASFLLQTASSHFANHVCNDFQFPNNFTEKEKQALLVEYNYYNCGRNITPDDDDWIDYPGDSGWMSFLAYKFMMESIN